MEIQGKCVDFSYNGTGTTITVVSEVLSIHTLDSMAGLGLVCIGIRVSHLNQYLSIKP